MSVSNVIKRPPSDGKKNDLAKIFYSRTVNNKHYKANLLYMLRNQMKTNIANQFYYALSSIHFVNLVNDNCIF